MSYLINPIGVVRSNIEEAFLPHREELNREKSVIQENESELIIEEQYTELLDGIEDFSHILVLYWSHKAGEDARHVTKVHPAGREDYPLVGVFATRSPVRPNPVCATIVRLLERKENILKVQGLDAIDGSPIIDIKPSTPSFDTASEVRIPPWMKELTNNFSEKFS